MKLHNNSIKLKKILIALASLFSFFCICIIGFFIWYKINLQPVGTNETIEFTIDSGTSTLTVIDNLYNEGIIKNKTAATIYVKLNKSKLQAGVYELNKNMNLEEILKKVENGEVIDNTINVTFVEGLKIDNFAVKNQDLNLKSYIKTINQNFGYSEEEILTTISDEEYLKELINKYWFLTDEILDDKLYYALEGYLAPNTYTFKKDATIKEIIEKLLDSTDKILSEYKDEINNSGYTVHEILTMASIIEQEGQNSDDRAGVAGVFYNRLNSGWSLGSDVTTYYGAKVEMADRDLYQTEIDTQNAYNTRHISMAGKLPVGPICNPSKDSIIAVINPKSSNYYYFVADKNGKTYFCETYNEFVATINNLKQQNLWYEYK